MYLNSNTRLKALKTSILLLATPLFLSAQSLTGLWKGALFNDSTTVRKEQLFEIALTEYRGKVYGYSRSEFIVNDTLYYIIKRVKGTINGDVCEVTDDEILAYNFRGKLDKGIKVTSTFLRNKTDSSWYLAGSWKTNQTKRFYSVSGKVSLAEEKDLNASKIFPHLEELNLAKNVSFYNERQKQNSPMKQVEPDHILFASLIKAEKQATIENNTDVKPDASTVDVKTLNVSNTQVVRTNTEAVKTSSLGVPTKTEALTTRAEIKEDTYKPKTISQGDENDIARSNIKPEQQQKIDKPALSNNSQQVKTEIKTTPPPVKDEVAKTNIKSEQQQKIDKPVAAINTPQTKTEIKTAAVTQPMLTPGNKPEIKKSDALGIQTKTEQSKTVAVPVETRIERKSTIVLPEETAGRKSEYAQTVIFKSDSLQLALYDNGEIDGDTVSVFMNGQILMAKQGLKAAAIRKTIYLPPGTNDEFSLVLFADNLGKYPPNTGLLVVYDGEDIYNIRFSADLQKNAGVVFRRK